MMVVVVVAPLPAGVSLQIDTGIYYLVRDGTLQTNWSVSDIDRGLRGRHIVGADVARYLSAGSRAWL